MLMAIFFRRGGVMGEAGDRIDANIGAGASNVAVGKQIDLHIEQPQPVPQPLPPSHPFKQLSLADVFAALLDNPLTGEPGLVTRIVLMESKLSEMQAKQKELGESQIASQIERHVLINEFDDFKRNQYPRWFQWLVVVLAVVLIVLLLLVLIKVR